MTMEAWVVAAKDSTKSWIVDISDPALLREFGPMARKCHIALGCRDYSLFDFRIDPRGTTLVLGSGAILFFCSEISVLSAMTKASGTSLDTFFESMVQNALQGRS